jgi:hypothetical protein
MNFISLREALYWVYANTAMAHQALATGQNKYNRTSFMIRTRLYKGLISGSMNIASLYDDERERLQSKKTCVYCGTNLYLSLDHLVPKKYGGSDSADNLVYSCRSCNSSKGDKDLLIWYNKRTEFPPLMVLRRYLKLLIVYCEDHGIMDTQFDMLNKIETPFQIDALPLEFPQPEKIRY